MKHFDLLRDAPVPALDIPAPEKLETTEDYAELTQHMVAVYRTALNLIYRQQGPEARTQMLTMMVLLLSAVMPAQHPEYVAGYPASLNDIYTLVGSMLSPETERKAG